MCIRKLFGKRRQAMDKLHHCDVKDAKELLQKIEKLRDDVIREGNISIEEWEPKITRKRFLPSAENLFHYLAARRRDLRTLQEDLIPWGLSSLGRMEAKSLATIEAVMATLEDIIECKKTVAHPPASKFYEGMEILENNTNEIFGNSDLYTRIMVTIGTEAVEDQAFINQLVENGMNIARINCSHDDETIWLEMIRMVKEAGKMYDREIKISMEIAGPKIRIAWIYTVEKFPRVAQGEKIRVEKDQSEIGKHPDCKLVIGISIPEILRDIEMGHSVVLDDGSLECSVIEKDEQGLTLFVDRVSGIDRRVKVEHGVNFPNSNFSLSILSEKDKQDMAFAVEHADIVGFSFIKTAEDMATVQNALKELVGERADEIPLMAKIETAQAVENLSSIILQGASKNPLCIMIARGDLAIEAGYIRLSELQQEIMWICEAANIPTIWATEVLSNLIKRGIPTRAEITDATEGGSCECIMLNKGLYLPHACSMLRSILEKRQKHKIKKTYMLRALGIAKQ